MTLKLVLLKAYDKISWEFLFLAMNKLGMKDSVDMVRQLFHDA
jgi:hypothetical protein